MPLTVPPVSAVADVLKLWGLDGWLSPPLLPFVAPAEPIIGGVVTITIRAATSGPGLVPAYSIIARDLTGRFVVMAGAREVDGAVWGEIMSTAANTNHALGVLVDGSIRDRPTMHDIGLPVYGVDECVVGPNGMAHVAEVGASLTIGTVVINPRDSIVADATGCVRVCEHELAAVIEAAGRYAEAEERVVQALVAGEPLTAAYAYKKSIVDELRR